MELPNDVEEILSDDYEEGEILEEDNLYEDVSSLEEFSFGELDSEARNEAIVDLTKNEADFNVSKNHRKKEHKCKEDSVCRKERKGKHCYARIRKEKLPSSIKANEIEPSDHSFQEKNICKKEEVPLTGKRSNEKVRLFSPPSKLRLDYAKPFKHDYKDYHEKENRISNKRHWKSNEKFSKSKFKHFDKAPRNKLKEYKSKYNGNSLAISAYRSHSGSNTASDSASSKTSLLKRLVGSGTSGVKTLKENEAGLNSDGHAERSQESTGESAKPSETESKQQAESTPEAEPVKANETKKLVDDNLTPETGKHQNSKNPEPMKKNFGLVWKRSMKDDKDELHLRVEALKSAWLKKFSERKKKGFINQKKSNGVEDSLVDFVLDTESEEDEKTVDKADSSANFSSADISSDILKPEDMVIVATCDSNTEGQIICEPALQIGAPSANSDSSVFIPSTFICLPDSDERTSPAIISGDPLSVPDSSISTYDNKSMKVTHKLHEPVLRSDETPNVNKGSSYSEKNVRRAEKKKKMRKIKKNRRRESLKKSLSISKELDEENILREKALMSLRINTKPVNNNFLAGKGELKPSVSSKAEQSVQLDKPVVATSPDLPLAQLISENKLKDKKLSALCESEGNGATSSDNLEDEIDEDILRAQLLSSLSKQVTETVEVVFNKTPTLKKVIHKKQDKRRVKNHSKNIWKNVLISSEKKIIVNELKRGSNMKHFGNVRQAKENRPTVGGSSSVGGAVMPPIPQVAKMIIAVGDSDSSSDMELDGDRPEEETGPCIVPSDIEANIELLLQEAKQNSLFEKLAASTMKPQTNSNSADPAGSGNNFGENRVQKNTSNKPATPPASLARSSVATSPQVMSCLPAWQLEEYRRLKKQLAEREKARQKVMRGMFPKKGELVQKRSEEARLVESAPKAAPLMEGDPTVDGDKAPIPPASSGESPPAGEKVSCTVSDELGPAGSDKVVPVGSNKVLVPTENDKASPQVDVKTPVISGDSQDVHPQKKQSTYSLGENINPEKKPFPNIASCSVMEEINVMNDIVIEFDKSSLEYSELKKKLTRLRKALKWTESKITEKKKSLLIIKDNIQKKDRMISSKIDKLKITQVPTVVKNKPVSRDMELIKLKYKEVSLKAQVLFHNFTSQLNKPEEKVGLQTKESEKLGRAVVKRPVDQAPAFPMPKKALSSSPAADMGKDATEQPAKRTFSGKERERGDWDPNTPVCHFDLHGICKDQECKYQHFKTV